MLDGQKLWISNAGEAGLFLIFATVDPSKGYKGITAFIVDRNDAGFRVGKRESKLGIRASSTCELILEQCRIPGDRVLGEVGKGYKIAIETLNEGRIGIGAQMLGLAGAALDAALQYTQQRKQFGASPSAPSRRSSISWPTAPRVWRLPSSWFTTRVACATRASRSSSKRRWPRSSPARPASSSPPAAVELFGGYGFSTEYPVEKYYRDAKVGKIYEGTSFMQLNTIAKIVLSE